MNDKKLNKITGLTQDQKDKFYADYVTNSFSFELDFVINEKPVPYARARAGRNGFYNPKADVETKYLKKICLFMNPKNIYYLFKDLQDSQEFFKTTYHEININDWEMVI